MYVFYENFLNINKNLTFELYVSWVSTQLRAVHNTYVHTLNAHLYATRITNKNEPKKKFQKKKEH